MISNKKPIYNLKAGKFIFPVVGYSENGFLFITSTFQLL